jgi:hypothetical protein
MLLRNIGPTTRVLVAATSAAIVVLGVILAGAAVSAAAPKPSRTTFGASAKQVTEGQNVTLKATVSPVAAADGSPTGSVEFFDGATSLGSVNLAATESGIEASLTLGTLAIGPHPISAVYSGSDTFGGSVSVPEFVLVLAR